MEASGTSRLRFTQAFEVVGAIAQGKNGISVCLEQLPFVEKPCLGDCFMRWMVAKSRTSALSILCDISLCRELRSCSESPDKFCRCEESGESGCPRCIEDGGDLRHLPFFPPFDEVPAFGIDLIPGGDADMVASLSALAV
jgi:hypothetical protein